MALIKCNNCGGMVSDKAKACPHCGTPVAANNCSQDSKAPTQGPNEYYEESKRKSNAGLIVAVVLGLLALLGVGGWLWYDNQQKRIALEQLHEQARQDSITQAELREKVRKDSIAKVQKQNQINTIYNEYVNVLKKFDGDDNFNRFFLYDITNDGVPELCVDGHLLELGTYDPIDDPQPFYIFAIQNQKAKRIFKFDGFGGFYYQGDNCILRSACNEDLKVARISYLNGRIVGETIYNAVDDGGENPTSSKKQIATYNTRDYSSLKKEIKTYFSD